MVGMANSLPHHLGKIARNMPLPTRQKTKKQRIRCLLTNESLTPATLS